MLGVCSIQGFILWSFSQVSILFPRPQLDWPCPISQTVARCCPTGRFHSFTANCDSTLDNDEYQVSDPKKIGKTGSIDYSYVGISGLKNSRQRLRKVIYQHFWLFKCWLFGCWQTVYTSMLLVGSLLIKETRSMKLDHNLPSYPLVRAPFANRATC